MDRKPFPTNFAIYCAYERLVSHLLPFAHFAVIWTAFGVVALIVAPMIEAIVLRPFTISETPDEELIVSVSLLHIIVVTGASICISVSWHRFIIMNEPPGQPLPAPLVVIWDYTWRLLVLAVAPVFIFVVAVWYVVIVTVVAYPASLYNAIDVAEPIVIALFAPFMLALPASAVGDHRVTFKESRRLTRGSVLALIRGVLACSLPFTFASVLIGELTSDWTEYSLAAEAADYVSTLLDMMSAVVGAAFISFAYLHFTEGTPSNASPESHF